MRNITPPRNPAHVAAFAVFGWQGMDRVETVYFVDGDAVYSTGERLFNNAFNPKGQQWARVNELPEAAEFIGNYARPYQLLTTPNN